ncbi:MAG: hypothetical protein LQ342_005667 [Letrouitia transgressa]|nr:MAG: hypothetical protein LQ342_005667 [Letrouitia transgressa]
MEEATYPNVIYGTLASLYSDLEVPDILLLEKAIALRNLRNFDQSLVLFESFPKSTAIKPAIALEHTWTLITQSRFKDAHAVATNASAWCPFETCSTNFLPTLWRVFLAGLDIVMGTETSNVQNVLTLISTSLTDVPLESYTDLQIWLINVHYYLLSISPHPASRSHSSSLFQIPKPSPTIVASNQPLSLQDPTETGLTRLRMHLQNTFRLSHALFLLETELPFLPSKDAEIEALESLRSAASNAFLQNDASDQPLSYIEGSVAVKLAHIYAEFGDDEGYRECLFDASAELSEGCGDECRANILRTETWLARLELAKAQSQDAEQARSPETNMEEDETDNGRLVAEAWEEFAEYAAQVGDFRTELRAWEEALVMRKEAGNADDDEATDGLMKKLKERREWSGVPNGMPIRRVQVPSAPVSVPLAVPISMAELMPTSTKEQKEMGILPVIPEQSDINAIIIEQRGMEDVDAVA